MKTLILILIILSFIQTTILPLNMVLIILIARSLIRPEKNNLILAFGFGLLTAHLSLQPLGFQSFIYLILVQITQVLSKTRVSANPLIIMPIVFVFVSADILATSLLARQSINLIPQVLIETLISLPIFYLIRLWEERFIVRHDIRLKM